MRPQDLSSTALSLETAQTQEAALVEAANSHEAVVTKLEGEKAALEESLKETSANLQDAVKLAEELSSKEAALASQLEEAEDRHSADHHPQHCGGLLSLSLHLVSAPCPAGPFVSAPTVRPLGPSATPSNRLESSQGILSSSGCPCS